MHRSLEGILIAVIDVVECFVHLCQFIYIDELRAERILLKARITPFVEKLNLPVIGLDQIVITFLDYLFEGGG